MGGKQRLNMKLFHVPGECRIPPALVFRHRWGKFHFSSKQPFFRTPLHNTKYVELSENCTLTLSYAIGYTLRLKANRRTSFEDRYDANRIFYICRKIPPLSLETCFLTTMLKYFSDRAISLHFCSEKYRSCVFFRLVYRGNRKGGSPAKN